MKTEEAREQLEAVVAAQNRTAALRTYRDAGSVVSAWGFVWFAGFMSQQFQPAIALYVWSLGWVAALGWTMTRPRRAYDAKALATWVVAVAFIILLLTVTGADWRLTAMVSGLALAAAYAVLGVWIGARFLILAGVVLAASCAGWWFAPDGLFGVLAIGGGGALIIGGFWLQRP